MSNRIAPDARRQALIEATVRALATHGAAGVSVRAIAKEANVSPGLLTHYFAGVDDLIAAAYVHVGDMVDHALNEAMDAAGEDPRARLSAYVVASFRPPVSNDALLATWLAFWSLVKSSPEIARLHGQIYAGYRVGIEDLVRRCAPGVDPRLTAIAITALVDGLWLEHGLDSSTFTPEEASAMAEKWLETLLGG
ncbi:transcriptional regulator BetI [Flavisphingomonas formosensis]|uniref:transcriptional regulator BetI n=1 Tax=Flavisphingomonas formosensis TaxID=861534 RepID=UPI0012FC3AC5|nr:transcriptional regulator BetI [Sphingomonas formosensis]